MSTPPDSVLRATDDAARQQARSLLRSSRHGALASLEPGTGWPWASRVSLSADAQATVLILISRLSAHYDALQADARCSLLVGEMGDGDPLRYPRLSLVCLAQKLPPEQRADARAQFILSHPDAKLYCDFSDFDYWQLRVQRAYLNAGFGKAYALTPQDLRENVSQQGNLG